MILEKKVSEIMSTPVVVVHFSERLNNAVKEMYKANVGSVIVINDYGEIIGILTRKDIVYLAASGALAKNPRLSEVVSSSIVTASLDDTILDVLKRMIEAGVRHIPIVEENRIVGVVSLSDIARYLGESLVSICTGQGNL